MKKNETIGWVAAVILIGGLMFFAGTKSSFGKKNSFANNIQRQGYGQNVGAMGGAGRTGGQRFGGAGSGLIGGEILAKDDKSITVKMRDGGSRIIFFTNSTDVLKSTTGTPADLKVGDNVSASGPANPDGSINAVSIQLRPDFAISSTTRK